MDGIGDSDHNTEVESTLKDKCVPSKNRATHDDSFVIMLEVAIDQGSTEKEDVVDYGKHNGSSLYVREIVNMVKSGNDQDSDRGEEN